MATKITLYADSRGNRFDTEEEADLSDIAHGVIVNISTHVQADMRVVADVVNQITRNSSMLDQIIILADYHKRNR